MLLEENRRGKIHSIHIQIHGQCNEEFETFRKLSHATEW